MKINLRKEIIKDRHLEIQFFTQHFLFWYLPFMDIYVPVMILWDFKYCCYQLLPPCPYLHTNWKVLKLYFMKFFYLRISFLFCSASLKITHYILLWPCNIVLWFVSTYHPDTEWKSWKFSHNIFLLYTKLDFLSS